MSSKQLARHLASYGRNGDDLLIHINQDELRGLQALAKKQNTTLTTNPDTGLPEAFNLGRFGKSMLPTIAGLGLTALSGGALSPLMAAGLVGGGTAIGTGNLQQGLMAGLGAWGGGALGSSLATMGADAAAQAAAQTATADTAAQLGVQNAATGANSQAALLAGQNAGMGPAGLESVRSAAQYGAQNALPGSQFAAEYGAFSQPPLPAVPSHAANVGAGFNQAISSPEAFANFAKDNYGKMAAAFGPSIMDATLYGQGGGPSGSPYSSTFDPSKFRAYEPEQPDPYYKPKPPDLGYAARGGLAMDMYANGGKTEDTSPYSAFIKAFKSPFNYPFQPQQSKSLTAGGGKRSTSLGDQAYRGLSPYQAAYKKLSLAGNLAQMPKGTVIEAPENIRLGILPELGSAAPTTTPAGYVGAAGGGRLLRGAGDGVSDSIPATIGGTQPARLADGEFVIPARIVSELGNGSTDAGAKRLYAMMDRVQKKRRKAKDIAADTKSYKELPA